MRKIGKLAMLLGMLGVASAPYMMNRFPELQGIKNRVLPMANVQQEYQLPTCQEPNSVEPIQREELVDERTALEDKIAQLIISKDALFGHKNYPGGMVLTKPETRTGHLFGLYHCYDPQKTRDNVTRILDGAEKNDKRVLVYDEGEGGFVGRVGT